MKPRSISSGFGIINLAGVRTGTAPICGQAKVETMSIPFTQPPATVIYLVRINSEEWEEYKTPVNSSKLVADNIKFGNEALVEFRNAASPQVVLNNFNKRVDEWLRQLGHTAGFVWAPTELGIVYRLAD